MDNTNDLVIDHERASTLKVGDLLKAIEGIDPMVRLLDVPAVRELLAAEPTPENAERLETYRKMHQSALLLQTIGKTFSQDLSKRDLQMAALLNDEAQSIREAAGCLSKAPVETIEMRLTERQDLIDLAIAQTAAFGMFGLAQELEQLSAALDGDDERIANWKKTFAARRRHELYAGL